jgi:hypothetical protein
VFHNHDEPPGEAGIRLVAFHEVCELLLARMLICATARYVSRDEIEEAKHEIIRTLENVLFLPEKKDGQPQSEQSPKMGTENGDRHDFSIWNLGEEKGA